MREFVTIRMPWRSLLVIGMVAMVAVPSWSLSQQPADVKKPETTESRDQVIRLTGQQVQGDVELVSDDKQPQPKEADRLDRLAKQLDALLKEIRTLRGEKPTTGPKRVDFVPGSRTEGKVIILSDKTATPKKVEKGDKVETKDVVIFTDKNATPKTAHVGGKDEVRFQVVQPVEKTAATAPTGRWATTSAAKDGQTFAFTVDATDGNSTMLSRTTYKMPKEKAEALANFLKDQVKNPVLETKVEGDSIIVTTTPDAQQTIGQFIGLVQGKAIHARINVHTVPSKASDPVKVLFDEKPEKR
jgi:hypothetical protein